MLNDAHSGLVTFGSDTMRYIAFGRGEKLLVIIPGLGDGLAPVGGKLQAAAFAQSYRRYGRAFRVYLFSRKDDLPEGYSTRDMADDLAKAMQGLNIGKASVLGVSQGGMIAQYLAIDHPELVEKLVLAVTLCRQNETVQTVIPHWMALAMRNDHKALMVDTMEKSYSEKYLRTHRWLYPVLGRIGKPDNYTRFLIQAAACLEHDSHAELKKIHCSTLIIGGGDDKIVGPHAAQELTKQIKGSKLFIYKGLGHAAYEEAADFHTRVLKFLLR